MRTRGEEFQANVSFLGDQFSPAVASQPGRSMVVWGSAPFAPRGVYGRVFDDLGRPVSPELTVDGEPEIPGPYQIAADAYGGFLVAWLKSRVVGTSTQFSVVAQRFDGLGGVSHGHGQSFPVSGCVETEPSMPSNR